MSREDRVGCSCTYRHRDFECHGHLRAWSTQTSGEDTFPVGIFEDERTGEMLVIRVEDIKFKEPV